MHSDLLQVAEIGWSPERRLTSAEGACELLFGEDGPALIGKALHDVLGISEERARELDAGARTGGRICTEFLTSNRLPEPRTLRLVLGVFDGRVTAAVMNLGLALAGAPPVQISRLSSSLSHEIRNPLSSVKMAVQTLGKNASLSERDQRRLVIANREIRTIERMLWLLSEYGRDTPPLLEPVVARSLILEVATVIEPELAERKIQVTVQEQEALPRIRVDAGRLRPVLAQVFLNVATSQPAGSEVQVQLRHGPGGGCELVLDDPGAAIPPEEQATLFEPFGSRLARGAGLSLAALHRVMLSFGGTLQAAGGPSPGTVLTLCFPP